MAKNKKTKKTREVPVIRENFTCLQVQHNQPVSNDDGTYKNKQTTFFTYKKNHRYLVELSRSLGVVLSYIKVVKEEILPLSNLVLAIAGEPTIAEAESDSKKKDKPNERIKKFVLLRQKHGDGFYFKDLNKILKREKYDLSETTIRRKLKKVLFELSTEGSIAVVCHKKHGEINYCIN